MGFAEPGHHFHGSWGRWSSRLLHRTIAQRTDILLLVGHMDIWVLETQFRGEVSKLLGFDPFHADKPVLLLEI